MQFSLDNSALPDIVDADTDNESIFQLDDLDACTYKEQIASSLPSLISEYSDNEDDDDYDDYEVDELYEEDNDLSDRDYDSDYEIPSQINTNCSSEYTYDNWCTQNLSPSLSARSPSTDNTKKTIKNISLQYNINNIISINNNSNNNNLSWNIPKDNYMLWVNSTGSTSN